MNFFYIYALNLVGLALSVDSRLFLRFKQDYIRTIHNRNQRRAYTVKTFRDIMANGGNLESL